MAQGIASALEMPDGREQSLRCESLAGEESLCLAEADAAAAVAAVGGIDNPLLPSRTAGGFQLCLGEAQERPAQSDAIAGHRRRHGGKTIDPTAAGEAQPESLHLIV